MGVGNKGANNTLYPRLISRRDKRIDAANQVQTRATLTISFDRVRGNDITVRQAHESGAGIVQQNLFGADGQAVDVRVDIFRVITGMCADAQTGRCDEISR